MASILRKFRDYHKTFGLPGLWLGIRTRLARRPFTVVTHPPGFEHPVHLRLKTTDLPTFQKIFLENEYEFPIAREPSFIIDAGANVGFASMYFARKFPKARIVAIEPEGSNFALLEKNVKPFPNVTPLQAALWNHTTTLNLVDTGEGPWAFQTHEDPTRAKGRVMGQIPAFSMTDLISRFGANTVDILKVDIEGGEKAVFSDAAGWIDRVGILMVELHDHYLAGCSDAFQKATSSFEHESRRGETVFKARKGWFK